MQSFIAIPRAARYVLRNAGWLTATASGRATGDAARGDIVIADGRIASLGAGAPSPEDAPIIDLRGGLVLPGFVDAHTHLDKGHIWARTPNPDGTFLGAITNVKIDREASWSREDVRARMDFALRCAYAHGTVAIRTHLDSLGPQADISWPLFKEMREEWRGRIDLQASALFPFDLPLDDPAAFRLIVDHVVSAGGALGGVTYRGLPLKGRIEPALDIYFETAKRHGLDLDFHADESDEAEARSLEHIADAALRHDFEGSVLCGHCCSLALMDDEDRARVIDKLARARVAVVSLPMCNMYLQDRAPGRTPRWRGVTPLQELAAGGVRAMVASDNTRDPFYAYGDLDMLEVWREATRILHLDHPFAGHARMVSAIPAGVMGLEGRGELKPGAKADLVIVPARSMNELFARPWRDRVVLRDGAAIDTTLPDYHELDEQVLRRASR
ncbi:cytosine deaminase [Terrarubrum flagellatum]|uniref:cytosine deaminase n=1 Tax=Terrirubrum flagellatum TaxID=2895980 RepID=UPI003144E05C